MTKTYNGSIIYAMLAKKKRKLNSAERLKALSKIDTRDRLKHLPRVRVLLVSLVVVCCLSLAVLSVVLATKVNPFFLLLVVLSIALAVLLIRHIVIVYAKEEDYLMKINAMYLAIKHMPVLFLCDRVFCNYSSGTVINLSKNLIKTYRLEDSAIYKDRVIYRKSLQLSDLELERFFNQRNAGGKMRDKKIAIILPKTECDFSCDNCGNSFAEGERFCNFCGTLRKDLRRRV